MSVQNNPYSETFTAYLIDCIKKNNFPETFYVVYTVRKADSIYLTNVNEGDVLASCSNVKIKLRESSDWISAFGNTENLINIQYVSFKVSNTKTYKTFTSVIQVDYDGTNCVLSTPRNINNNILKEMQQTENFTTEYLNDYLLDCLENPFTPLYYNTTVLASQYNAGNNITLAYTLRGNFNNESLDYPGLTSLDYFDDNKSLYQTIKNYIEGKYPETKTIESWHYGVGNEDLVYAWNTNNTPWYIGKAKSLTIPDKNSVNLYYYNNCEFLYEILNKEMTEGIVYYFDNIAISDSNTDKIITTTTVKPSKTIIYQVTDVTLRRHGDKRWMTVKEYNADPTVDYTQIDYIKYYTISNNKEWWYCCIVEVTTQQDLTVQFASPRNCGYDIDDANRNSICKMIDAVSPTNYDPDEDENSGTYKKIFNNFFQDCLENPFAFMYYSKKITELSTNYNGNVLYLCYYHLFNDNFYAPTSHIETYDIFDRNSQLSWDYNKTLEVYLNDTKDVSIGEPDKLKNFINGSSKNYKALVHVPWYEGKVETNTIGNEINQTWYDFVYNSIYYKEPTSTYKYYIRNDGSILKPNEVTNDYIYHVNEIRFYIGNKSYIRNVAFELENYEPTEVEYIELVIHEQDEPENPTVEFKIIIHLEHNKLIEFDDKEILITVYLTTPNTSFEDNKKLLKSREERKIQTYWEYLIMYVNDIIACPFAQLYCLNKPKIELQQIPQNALYNMLTNYSYPYDEETQTKYDDIIRLIPQFDINNLQKEEWINFKNNILDFYGSIFKDSGYTNTIEPYMDEIPFDYQERYKWLWNEFSYKTIPDGTEKNYILDSVSMSWYRVILDIVVYGLKPNCRLDLLSGGISEYTTFENAAVLNLERSHIYIGNDESNVKYDIVNTIDTWKQYEKDNDRMNELYENIKRMYVELIFLTKDGKDFRRCVIKVNKPDTSQFYNIRLSVPEVGYTYNYMQAQGQWNTPDHWNTQKILEDYYKDSDRIYPKHLVSNTLEDFCENIFAIFVYPNNFEFLYNVFDQCRPEKKYKPILNILKSLIDVYVSQTEIIGESGSEQNPNSYYKLWGPSNELVGTGVSGGLISTYNGLEGTDEEEGLLKYYRELNTGKTTYGRYKKEDGSTDWFHVIGDRTNGSYAINGVNPETGELFDVYFEFENSENYPPNPNPEISTSFILPEHMSIYQKTQIKQEYDTSYSVPILKGKLWFSKKEAEDTIKQGIVTMMEKYGKEVEVKDSLLKVFPTVIGDETNSELEDYSNMNELVYSMKEKLKENQSILLVIQDEFGTVYNEMKKVAPDSKTEVITMMWKDNRENYYKLENETEPVDFKSDDYYVNELYLQNSNNISVTLNPFFESLIIEHEKHIKMCGFFLLEENRS